MNDTMNARAGGTIHICRFVLPDTANPNGAIEAAAGTILPLGISTDQSNTRPDPDIVGSTNLVAATVGQPIKLFTNGKKGCSVYCNAAWNPGDLLMAGANGYGVVCTPGNYYGARAQTAGTVASLCTVDVITGFMFGGAINGTAQALTSSGTITFPTNSEFLRVSNTGAVTGMILTVGTSDGQTLTIINTSANSVTFATAATSNVSGGTAVVIAASQALTFYWSAADSYWFPI